VVGLQDSVVPSWSLVFHAWAWDYAMLLLGMVQMYFGRSPLGYFSAAASTFCMLRLFGKIATMTDMSIANAATSMEIQSLRGPSPGPLLTLHAILAGRKH
jgi:hypothetical protein